VSRRSESNWTVSSGWSPDSTITSSASPTAARAERTASPVPSGTSWITTDRSANSSPVSGDATTTSGSAARACPRPITQSTIRRPSSGCRCFGVAERIRVPWPAAITTAASEVSVTVTEWLGRQDSNLGSRDQNPLPYRLATPHGTQFLGISESLCLCHFYRLFLRLMYVGYVYKPSMTRNLVTPRLPLHTTASR